MTYIDHTDRNVFLFSLVFTVLVSLAVQLVIVPAIPEINGGHGLLAGGDAVGFHDVAVQLAETMRSQGWSGWELRPNTWAPAGIAAAFYYATGIYEPFVLIPLNCLLYSVGMYFIYCSIRRIMPSAFQWMAISPLLLFPSSLIIYSQISRDVLTFSGVSVFLFLLVSAALHERTGFRTLPRYFILAVAASALLWVGRPYLLKVVAVCLAATYLVLIGWRLMQRKPVPVILLAIMLVVPVGMSFLGADDKAVLVEAPPATQSQAPQTSAQVPQTSLEPAGRPAPYSLFDRVLDTINATRSSFLRSFESAGSNIDVDVHFDSYVDVFAYVPRAITIGLAAPFPTTWFASAVESGGRMMRLLSAGEMFIAYLSYAGLLLLLLSPLPQKSPAVIVLLFCAGAIVLYVVAVPNVGSLYRMRYPFWQTFVCFGVLGWTIWLSNPRARGP